MIKHVTLEMSLKPFKKTDDEYIKETCVKLFEQWKPLTKHAQEVSVMLWASDGSEILEYQGDLEQEIEWCRYIGGANPLKEWNREKDPNGLGLHTRNYLYIDNPPKITYGTLKKIIHEIKKTGSEILKKNVTVGETFDPGPEFAKSDFKYKRHREICGGESMGKDSMVCCYGVLNGDNERYAGFAKGIPDRTNFGTFLGKQSKIFLTDMGFDYLWLSNGFGFGSETWGIIGAIFDREKFDAQQLDSVGKRIIKFWELFRKECPDIGVRTRGTNLSAGLDYATDGVPLMEIYGGGFDILPPPNSPWAALNQDFGLELMGHMSRIAQLPSDQYMFRYYIHDPWWVNSPWYDRYEGQPHDIYLPMAVSRIDQNGKVKIPTHLSLLTIDNSFGEMPDSCVNEPMPHLLKAFKDAPDRPAPVVWVYPFEQSQTSKDQQSVQEIFFGDWYIRGAINNGLALSGVVSVNNFMQSVKMNDELYSSSVLVSMVPQKDTDFETIIMEYVEKGGKVIFYGNVGRASEKFLDLIQVKRVDPIAGECEFTSCHLTDKHKDGHGYPNKIKHVELFSGGGINTVLKDKASGIEALGRVGQRVMGILGKNFAWVSGTSSYRCEQGEQLPVPESTRKFFCGEILMRVALAQLGYRIEFVKQDCGVKTPVIMISRSDNGFMFSVYSPNTTVTTRFKFPHGAPIIMGYETMLDDGFSVYNFPRAEHRECRAFVQQQEGIVYCKDIPPVSKLKRRRIEVGGLKNATVRFFSEEYCKEDTEVLLDSLYPFFVGKPLIKKCIAENQEVYYEIKNVTGKLLFSMPARNV